MKCFYVCLTAITFFRDQSIRWHATSHDLSIEKQKRLQYKIKELIVIPLKLYCRLRIDRRWILWINVFLFLNINSDGIQRLACVLLGYVFDVFKQCIWWPILIVRKKQCHWCQLLSLSSNVTNRKCRWVVGRVQKMLCIS